ncbi:hypothetical protein SOM26_16065 [Sphingomonas sp. CFBP8993]|uniref:hypothetical protein n=1 Tax=Sphingomonas sp. CFBP8993 TaxID=3096526 RepID=UPI002A69F92A|nr:hypothetical protein [Sphingomonas sp. CFBP8993]MDY0960211.1 hypothetical protein [Sphingomonas sp. CFBP8993]
MIEIDLVAERAQTDPAEPLLRDQHAERRRNGIIPIIRFLSRGCRILSLRLARRSRFVEAILSGPLRSVKHHLYILPIPAGLSGMFRPDRRTTPQVRGRNASILSYTPAYYATAFTVLIQQADAARLI